MWNCCASLREAAKSKEGIYPFAASGLIICWPIRQIVFFRELVKYHVSGQLKVAPEHVSDRGAGDDGKTASMPCIMKFVGTIQEA